METGINFPSVFQEVKKATGLDNLPSKFLEISWADIFAPSLTFKFNQSICSGIVPIDWKLACVTPVFKKGARKDVNNNRPISIIKAAAWIFERTKKKQFYR